MNILVANLGSTSFKFRLFEMEQETELARGSIDRIGHEESRMQWERDGQTIEKRVQCPDHSTALSLCLQPLGLAEGRETLDGIGFKAVHGGKFSGVQRVDEQVLEAMSEMNDLAPAHNPIYVKAMRSLRESFPEVPLVAAFETGFHQTVAPASREYAIPTEWSNDHGVKRWGFHGASHRYISERVAQLAKKSSRTVSLHLGGSSSLCAIRDGQSIATTMGMSPQTGLPQSNRVGDFDPFSIPYIMERTKQTLEEVLHILANESGLLGISQVSGDMRDLQKEASQGNASAQLALDVYVYETRRHLGGLMLTLGGLDTLVFTGGTGENGVAIRQAICADLESFGICLDADKNATAKGECNISDEDAAVDVWVIPTNEERIVARQTAACLKNSSISER